MQNKTAPDLNQNPPELESIKEEIKVTEISRELVNIDQENPNIVRHGDSLLLLPREGLGDSTITIISEPENFINYDKENTIPLPELKNISTVLDYMSENHLDNFDLFSITNKVLVCDPVFAEKVWEQFKKNIGGTVLNKGVKRVKKFAKNIRLLDTPIDRAKFKSILSPNKKFLFLQRDKSSFLNKVYIYTISDDSGNLLPCDKWKLKEYDDFDEFKKDINRFPSFKIHTLSASKSALIEEKGMQVELQENGNFEVYDKMDSLVKKIAGVSDFVQDKLKPEIFYVADGPKIQVYDFKKGMEPVRTLTLEVPSPLSFWVKSIVLDNRNNVLICSGDYISGTSDRDRRRTGSQNVFMISKTTGEILYDFKLPESIKKVSTQLAFTSDGTLIIPRDGDEKALCFKTNLNDFEEGVMEMSGEERKRKKLLEQLKGKSSKEIQKELEELEKSRKKVKAKTTEVLKGEKKEDPLIEALQKKINEVFKDKIIDAAGNIKELKNIQRQMTAMKSGEIDPAFKEFPQVFKEMEELLEENLNKALLEDIREKMIKLSKRALVVEEYTDMKTLEEEFSKLMQQRRIIDEAFNGEELEARKIIQNLRDKIKEKQDTIRKTLYGRLEKQWVAVETVFENILTIEDLEKSYELQEVVKMEELFELIDDRDILREWRGRLSKIKAETRDKIKAREHESVEKEKQKTRDLISSISDDIEVVEDELDSLSDEKSIDDYYNNSPLVKKISKRLANVDAETKKDLWGRLKRAFQDRKKELTMIEKIESAKGDEVTFDNVTFPKFTPEQSRIEVFIEPLRRNAKIGTLVFRDNTGKTFKPDVGSLPVDTSDHETREIIELYREDAKYALFGEKAEKVRPLVPTISKEWVISKSAEKNLGAMARLLKKQVKRQNGILIMVGEAGSGKNVLADIFSHFTNREAFEFSCNAHTEKEDVQFSFEFDVTKGTYKVPSNVIKALQTPGAVIIFDEINTLPPGVSKILNALFDHRRKLIMPDGTIIKAHPSVIIIGLMNPGNYRGTIPLPQEIRSRARMLSIGYPKDPMDEGVMYSPLTTALKDLNQQEFEALWNKIFNGTPSDIADKVETEEAVKQLRKIKEMIKVGNLIRDRYRDTQMGLSKPGEEVNFVFSLRDGGQVVEELEDNPGMSVKDAMKSIILPKIDDPSEEKTMLELLDNA